MLLYGDASIFRAAEKVAVLDRFGETIASSPSFRWYDWAGRPFPALVTPDMRAITLERLAGRDHSDKQRSVEFDS